MVFLDSNECFSAMEPAHREGGGGYIEKALKRSIGVLDAPHRTSDIDDEAVG
jgi:hypothetical protein